MKKLLWELESEFKEELQNRSDIAKYDDITLKEMLDLGFNNNYLVRKNDYSYRKQLGYVDSTRQYSYNFTEEQLNVRIVLKEYDFDSDGYTIAKVYLANEEDYKLFDDMK